MKPEVRDRFVLPLLIPLGILASIALVATAFGMLMFFSPMAVSVVVAIVVAGAVLAGFGLATSRPESELSGAQRGLLVMMGALPLAVLALVAFDAIPVDAEKVAEREPHAAFGVEGDTATLGADEFLFEPAEFSFEQAGEVEFVVENEGAVLHTFVIEEHEDALKLEMPSGQEDEGAIELEPGSYVFYCDVSGHREAGMEGTFEVGG